MTTLRAWIMVGVCLLAVTLAACGGGGGGGGVSEADVTAIASDTSYSSRGDAANGEVLFVNCTPCHSTGTDQIVGPGLAGLFSAEGPTLPSGVDDGGKLPNGNIRTETNVATWILNGGQGEIGVMPAQALDDQQLADVIAYLRTLQK